MKLQSAYSRGGRVLEGRGAYSKGALDSYRCIFKSVWYNFGLFDTICEEGGGGGRVFMHNALRLFLF